MSGKNSAATEVTIEDIIDLGSVDGEKDDAEGQNEVSLESQERLLSIPGAKNKRSKAWENFKWDPLKGHWHCLYCR